MNFLEVAGSRTIFDSLDITESTKQDYLARLPYFLGFANRDGITRDLLLNYKKHLRSRTDLGVASKNKYLAVARLTVKELYRQGYISIDLSLNVKSFQQNQKHKVDGLNDVEMSQLLEYLETLPNDFKSIRLKALVSLLLYQGLRQIEICRLDVTDIDLASRRIYVRGKGRDDREPIYLHPQTVKALTSYLKASRVKDGALFTSLWGQSKGKRLSTRGLRQIIQQTLQSIGIYRTVHGFRHTFTTKLIKAYDGNLTTVARFTRHRNMDTLIIYNDEITHLSNLDNYHKAFNIVNQSINTLRTNDL